MSFCRLIKSVVYKGDTGAVVMALACANLVSLDCIIQPPSPTMLVGACVQAGRE